MRGYFLKMNLIHRKKKKQAEKWKRPMTLGSSQIQRRFLVLKVTSPTLCDLVELSLVNGKKKSESESVSSFQLSVTLWIEAHQAPLFMGFSTSEYWSG